MPHASFVEAPFVVLAVVVVVSVVLVVDVVVVFVVVFALRLCFFLISKLPSKNSVLLSLAFD